MADDNILAQLLSSGAGTEANYYSILNRKTAVDDIGDAFSSQANRPALNGKQRMSNAMMAGMGAGLKASQTHIRDKKMQEVEGMLKEVVDQRVKLQSQLGKQQLTKASFANYAMDNYGDLKRWNDSEGAGDQQSSNEFGKVLYNRWADQNPDMAKKLGKIDHVYGGKAYFDKDGKVGGMYIKDLLEPLISTLPEDQQKELSNLTSLTMRNKFKKSDLFEDLGIADKRASIKAHNASANQANAHADLFRSETNKNRQTALKPPKYDDKTRQHIAKSNIDWVNSANDDVKKTENAAKAYEMTAKILEDEKGWKGRGGNSLGAAVQRLINWEGTESGKNQALLDLYQQPLLEEFKYYFGARQTDNDLKQFLKTLPTLDKDSAASIQIATDRAATIRARNKETLLRAKILETEFNYGEPYNSQAVTKRVEEEMKEQLDDIGKK
jgi:hypothetical protein